jgi:hypothetical protein
VGIPLGGHAQDELAVDASDSGARIIDHMQVLMEEDGIGAVCWAASGSASVTQCRSMAERLRRNGTWVVPTLYFYDGAGGQQAQVIAQHFQGAVQAFWSDSTHVRNWLAGTAGGSGLGATIDSFGAMHVMRNVAFPIAAGTDSETSGFALPWGFSLHAELAMYVAEGLPSLTALQAATLNPAKLLHATDSLGTVAAGKLADLVLLDADPLADITNTTTIRAVTANGRYFDRAALDSVVTNIKAKVR